MKGVFVIIGERERAFARFAWVGNMLGEKRILEASQIPFLSCFIGTWMQELIIMMGHALSKWVK